MAQYKGFTPLGQSFQIHDPSCIDPLQKRLLSIPLYKAVPIDNSNAHPEKIFCSLGDTFDNCYMELEAVIARLSRDARKGDWEKFCNNQQKPVDLWCHDGSVCSKIPPNIFEDASGSGFDAWDEKQIKNWLNILVSSSDKNSSKSPDHGHFPEPATSVPLWFTPSKSNILTRGDIEHIFTEAFADESLGLHEHDAYYKTFDEAKEAGLVLVGSNPFHLYHMWMKREDYQNLWANEGVTTLEHEWPNKESADKINRILNNGQNACQERIVQVTHENYTMAAALGEHKDQKFAMGGWTASEVAKELWGTKSDKNVVDVEWLNRVHFCLGGLTSTVKSRLDARADPATPLARSNTILGTDGCKAHMTRTESAIINGLEADSRGGISALEPGMIWTNDNHINGTEIGQLTARGERTTQKVPEWMNKGHYPWISLELQYYTTMKCRSLGGVALCAIETFHPLSRYAPTLVEAKLDAYLAYVLKDHSDFSVRYHESIPPSPLPSPLSSPIALSPPGPSLVSTLLSPSPGFVKVGRISLFGSPDTVTDLYRWNAPPPADLKLRLDQSMSVEYVNIDKPFHLSSIISSLKRTAFDHITFKKGKFFHQNCLFDSSKPIGWHFSGEVVIDAATGALHDILTNVLGVENNTVEVQAALGIRGGWRKHLEPHSFSLEGIFPKVTKERVKGVRLTSIGVRLMAIRKVAYKPKLDSVLEYGFGVFGTMHLSIPNFVVPLTLDYEMRESRGMVNINASVTSGIWKNPFGVNGALRNTTFSASVPVKDKHPWEGFQFNVSALFAYRLTYTTFAGTYVPNEEFILSAYLPQFKMKDVIDLFAHQTGGNIQPPTLDTQIGSASIYLCATKGLEATLYDVVMAGYDAPEASLTISANGARIQGRLACDVVQFGDIQLNEPYLDVFMKSQASAKEPWTDPTIKGVVNFNPHLTFTATAYIYPGAKATEWTVLATLTDSKRPQLSLSKLVPELECTSFDVGLKEVVFVAASKDSPQLGQMIVGTYKFTKGVQICSKLNGIPILNKIVPSLAAALTLRAEWSHASGFKLKVLTSQPTRLTLAPTLHTEGIDISIKVSPPQLAITSTLKVPVANATQPLPFTFNLLADKSRVKINGEMESWWINPFGAGENVKIGPKPSLSLDVEYNTLPRILLPCISAGLEIGKTVVPMHFTFDPIPKNQFLRGEITELSKVDLVAFASHVNGESIKSIPDEFSNFTSVDVYLRPAEATIRDIKHPQGFYLISTMTLYGKQADITCCIRKKHLSIQGPIQDFELGPLKVKGNNGSRAFIDCEITSSNQIVRIGGKTVIYDDESPVHAETNAPGNPKLKFDSSLLIPGRSKVALHANYAGDMPIQDLKHADFTLDAALDDSIRQFIRKQVFLRFEKAFDAAKNDDAHYRLDKNLRKIKYDICIARINLSKALTLKNKKRDDVTEKKDNLVAEYEDQILHLQKAIDEALRESQEAEITTKQKVARIASIYDGKHSEACDALTQAERDENKDRVEAQADIDHTEQQLRSAASASEVIRNAKEKIEDIESKIKRIETQIRNTPSGRPTAELETSKRKHEAALDTIFTEAEKTPNYKNARNNAQDAKINYENLERAHRENIAAKEETLASIDKMRKDAVAAAEAEGQSIRATKQDDLAKAEKAKDDYETRKKPEISAAKTDLENLTKTKEFTDYDEALKKLKKAEGDLPPLLKLKEELKAKFMAKREREIVSGWVFRGDMNTFNITSVKLSGKLKSLVDQSGVFVKPLSAKVDIVVHGDVCGMTLDFHPGDFSEFIHAIYHRLWDHIRNDHCKAEIEKDVN